MGAELALRFDREPMQGAERDATAGAGRPAVPRRREPGAPALSACIGDMARGDERALAALYDATLSRVYGLALRIVRNAQSAEDVVSETYLRAWKNAADYSPARGPALAWLLVIARSRAIDVLREREREPQPAAETGDPDPAWFDGDPHDLLHATRSHRALHAAVAALEPRQRQLVALAFFRGLSHAEIAQHAGLPLGTVKTLIRRALVTLRDAVPADLANES